MFIGFYRLDGEDNFAIYYKCREGYDEWHKDTFSPTCEDIEVLDFKISGKDYREKQESLRNLAIDWQLNFSSLSWSYGELAEIEGYFYENGKRYGLLKEFKENFIC